MAILRTVFRVFLGVLPLGLTPLLGWLIAEGVLNFGGGEKDLLLLLPWLLWSLIYLAAFITLWVKRFSLPAALLWSLAVPTAALAVLFVALYLFSSGLLGVRLLNLQFFPLNSIYK